MECVNSTFLEEPKSSDRKHSVPLWAYVAIGTFLYAGIWSYIGILKILSLNAYVFDLGINSERGWQILHTNLGLHGYLTTLINSGIVFPLSPLTGSGNFFAMVIFQAFSVASVGLAIYFIAREKGLKSGESMLISFAFFLYFPVYGIMWFDFHYQVFFMPLFMFAYLLYLRKNYVASTFLFFLSGIVRYPYSIFPLAFASIELFLLFRNRQSGYERKRMVSMAFLLALMVIWTVLGFLLLGLSSTIPHSGASQYTGTAVTVWSRFYVILLFLAPLLFLPVLRARWIILVLPAFYLFLSSSYTWYAYPHVFQGQYAAGVAPFLFLGLIEYLAIPVKRKDGRKVKISRRRGLFPMKTANRPIVAILAILLFLNIFFAPFSPLNDQYGDRFNFQQNTSYNPLQYTELGSMVKMVPSSEAYVAYQNNIPEVLPRSLSLGGPVLVGGYLGSFVSISVGEALNNSWLVNSGGKILRVPIDYAIAEADNQNFYLPNESMYKLVEDMYYSGQYGIISEGYGLIMLKHNYTGPILNFVPESLNVSSKSFIITNQSGKLNFSYLSGQLPTNMPITLGDNRGYLFPGLYNVTIYLKSFTTLNNKIATFEVFANNGDKVVFTQNINKSTALNEKGYTVIHLQIKVNDIYGHVSFDLSFSDNNADFPLACLNISQIDPFQQNFKYGQNS